MLINITQRNLKTFYITGITELEMPCTDVCLCGQRARNTGGLGY